MDILLIAAKNFRDFITKHTVVFVIMLISLSVSTVTMLYVTVKLDSLSALAGPGEMDLNNISLKNEESQLPLDDISERLQNYFMNNSSVLYVSAAIDSSECYLQCFVTDEEKNLEEFDDKSEPLKGRFFTKEEIVNGENVMISVGIGAEIEKTELDGNEIQIIGSYSANRLTNGYIPMNTLKVNNIIPESYIITYNKDLSAGEIKKYKKELEELFPEFKIQSRLDYVLDEAPILLGLDFENVCLSLMAAVSIISCAYLYAYLIRMRIKEIYIFKLCGASTLKLLRIFLSELFMLLTLQLITALAVFKLCLMKFLKDYDIAFTYGFSWIHVLTAFAIIAALSVLIFLPVLLYYCRKNAIEIKQKQKG